VNSYATATGIGSWPGVAPRAAAEVVVGELHSLSHLPELPARGVGADMIGRAGALLVDIAIDTVPRGYRVAARPGAVTRRALSLLDEDIDALEEAWEVAGLRGSGRPIKVQAPGPVTLAAELELGNGHRALTDHGAVRDLTASLAEGVAAHRATIARRLETEVLVQFDEPVLAAALGGRVSGVTSLNPVAPVEEGVAVDLIDTCVRAVGVPVAVHTCAGDVPWKVLSRSGIAAAAVDAGVLRTGDLDGLGEFLETGRTVLLGVVPTTAPVARPSVEEVAQVAANITDRLGFPRRILADQVGVTPGCGLAGASAEWARRAVELCQKVADGFAQDPEAL
jgi:methionine synthase II (cobalamin-independent)